MAAAPARTTPPGASRREESFALAGLIALLLVTAAWWALALWPVHDGPAWLERTRYVCFGVAETGLPDAGGWVGLIGAPAGMLVMLLTGWWRGVHTLALRARTSAPLAGALGALLVGAALLAAAAGLRVRQARAAVVAPEDASTLPAADYPRVDLPAPPLSLTAHDGSPLDLAQLRGRAVLVTFAYAHCRTVCPLIVRHVLAARALLPAGVAPAVVIVTLDPWRDTPSRLASMAETWALPAHDAWVLGGEVVAVEAALDAWRIPRRRDPRTGEITHPSLVYIVAADGRIAFVSNGGAEAIASLVRRL